MRPRLIRLHHKTVEKLIRLRKEAESDGICRVARRIRAVVLNNDGLTSGEIAFDPEIAAVQGLRAAQELRAPRLRGAARRVSPRAAARAHRRREDGAL